MEYEIRMNLLQLILFIMTWIAGQVENQWIYIYDGFCLTFNYTHSVGVDVSVGISFIYSLFLCLPVLLYPSN